tara:strand:- start:116 stop:445 length:330 start_codon:yes stop_codon:yes gene_type:complete
MVSVKEIFRLQEQDKLNEVKKIRIIVLKAVRLAIMSVVEARVFGCDDLWNHIKSFLFVPRECWAKNSVRLGMCKGNLFLAYVQKHELDQQSGQTKFTRCLYTCKIHELN